MKSKVGENHEGLSVTLLEIADSRLRRCPQLRSGGVFGLAQIFAPGSEPDPPQPSLQTAVFLHHWITLEQGISLREPRIIGVGRATRTIELRKLDRRGVDRWVRSEAEPSRLGRTAPELHEPLAFSVKNAARIGSRSESVS